MMHPLLVSIGTGVLRNGLGYLNKAWADKKIEVYEWKQLAVTVCRTVLIGLFIHYGFNVEETMLAAGLTFFIDVVWQEVRKLVKK